MPNASLFPFEKITLNYKGGSSTELTGDNLEKALQYSSSVSNKKAFLD